MEGDEAAGGGVVHLRSLVPISGAPVGVYPRLHTLEEFRRLPRVLGPKFAKPRLTLRRSYAQDDEGLPLRPTTLFLAQAEHLGGVEALVILVGERPAHHLQDLLGRLADKGIANGLPRCKAAMQLPACRKPRRRLLSWWKVGRDGLFLLRP